MKGKLLIIWILFSLFSLQEAKAVEGTPIMRRACLNRLDSSLELLWFRPSDACMSFTGFSVYGRDNSLGIFQLLGRYTDFSISSINLKLPNLKDWEFYLVYNKTCNGLDSVFSDTIKIDNTPPINSQLDSVSVDLTSQKTIIGWSQNPSPDVKGYIVYHVTGTNSVISDSSKGTSFLDLGIRNPAAGPVQYSVAAYDSCNNTSLISNPHQTIYLQNVYDQCSKTISLRWSSYQGWPVESYQIFRKINAGNFQLVGSVVSNINQFTYNFNVFGDSYCFYIRALKTGGGSSSSSNSNCVNTTGIIESKNSYIAKASVQNKNIELSLVCETGSSLNKINIYKAEGNANFSYWQSVNTSGGLIELIDNNVNVSNKSYRYFFTTEGPCNLIFDSSQIAKTILLNAFMISPGDQTVSWSLYDRFIKSTLKQELLLSDNPNFNKSSPWNIIQTFTPDVFTSKDYSTFSTTQEQICYCVRAIENVPGSPFNRQDTSYSNIECLTADPIVYFPNAIQINGYNSSFFPKGVFIDYEKSSFQIFNRWGELVYETTDIRKAWTGAVGSEHVLSDVYAYKARIVGLNGKILYFDGTITVLK